MSFDFDIPAFAETSPDHSLLLHHPAPPPEEDDDDDDDDGKPGSGGGNIDPDDDEGIDDEDDDDEGETLWTGAVHLSGRKARLLRYGSRPPKRR